MKSLTTALLAAAIFASPVPAADLAPGSPAPRLSDVNWLQGAAIPEWKAGQVYVLDFWATWCGPCKASIPHLNQLHKDYQDKGVTIIGVAIWPNERMVPTAKFVSEQGEKMAYPICEDIDGRMAKAFMEASGSRGIPTAMIVDQTGKLAWIGHPADGLDEVLAAVVDKTFDAEAFAREKAAFEEADRALRAAMRDAEWDTAAELAQKLIDLNPKRYGHYAMWKYDILLRAEKHEDAAAFGRAAVAGVLADSSEILNGLAWRIVDPNLPNEEADLELAEAAVRRSDKLTEHSNPSVLDTLARVLFLKGDLAGALETQARAVDLAEEGEFREALEQRLAEYRSAQG